MLNETFYIDGVDARNFGIYLQKPIEFSEAKPIAEIQSIPGRNGDLVFETGSYENRTGIASCFCLQKNVEKAISAAGRFLMSKHGYRRLETSDDPDHFWLARIENSPSIAQRMRTLAPFEISFDCKPQRFLKSGEKTIIFENPKNDEPHKIWNLGFFTSKPLIHIKCKPVAKDNFYNIELVFYSLKHGNVWDERIKLAVYDDSDYYIDCDMCHVYNESGNQYSHFIKGSFPELRPGEFYFVARIRKQDGSVLEDQIEFVEIIPRWWEL